MTKTLSQLAARVAIALICEYIHAGSGIIVIFGCAFSDFMNHSKKKED